MARDKGPVNYRKVGKARKPSPRDLWRQRCPLFELRFENDETQAELAHILRVKQPKISGWERNTAPMQVHEVKAIASHFKVDAQEFLVNMQRWQSMEPALSEYERTLHRRRTYRKYSPIRRRLSKIGISAYELADKIGRCRTTIYAYSSKPDNDRLRLDIIKDISEVLDCGFAELCEEILEWQNVFTGVSDDDLLGEALIFEEKLAKRGTI